MTDFHLDLGADTEDAKANADWLRLSGVEPVEEAEGEQSMTIRYYGFVNDIDTVIGTTTVLADGRLSHSNELAASLTAALLKRFADDPEPLKRAPEYYDGAYLRAEVD